MGRYVLLAAFLSLGGAAVLYGWRHDAQRSQSFANADETAFLVTYERPADADGRRFVDVSIHPPLSERAVTRVGRYEARDGIPPPQWISPDTVNVCGLSDAPNVKRVVRLESPYAETRTYHIVSRCPAAAAPGG